MLKNKIVVRKIRNIVILLMAILIMIGAYKNIDRSRAENVRKIDVITIDSYGYLEQEELTLEAREIENNLYEIEIPEAVNSKKINKIIKCVLENESIGLTEENTIQLTKAQLEKGQIHIEVAYDMALVEINKQGKIEKILLSEKTEEERKKIEITENMQTLYNKILKYEDEENGKLVEVKGYLPQNARLQVEEVTQKELEEIFKDVKIDVAYDIKILVDVKTQVPTDEANPEAKPEEIIETIEINPEDLGETCEVTIKDTNIVANSQVYHVKEDDTYEKVDVKDSTDENISFEAQTFSIYAVSPASERASGTINKDLITVTGSFTTNTNSSVSASFPTGAISFYALIQSTSQPSTWQENSSAQSSISVPVTQEGTWYLHLKASNSSVTEYVGYWGPYTLDKTAPTYTVDPEGDVSWTKTKTIKVVCYDPEPRTGMASSSVKYTWKDSNSGGGDTTATKSGSTHTITGNDMTGIKYLGLTVTVRDVAGNSKTYNASYGPYYFDNTAPTIPTYTAFYTNDNSPYTSGTYTNKQVSTTFSATDGHSGVKEIQFSKDKNSWSKLDLDVGGATSKTFSGTEPWTLNERDDTYYFRVVDVAGNISEASEAFNIKYDLTAPTAPEMGFVFYDFSPYTQGEWTNTWVYAAQNNWSNPGPQSTDNSNEFQSGVAKYEISIDGTNWIAYDYHSVEESEEALLLYRMSTTGIHTRYFRTIDVAGNISQVTTKTAKIDMVKTKITINTQSNQDWAKTHTAEVTISDELSGLAEGGNIKYGWSLYRTQSPDNWVTQAISSHSVGTSSVTFSITENREILTGEYYLWIMPADDNSLKDVAGNVGAATAISTGTFWFDNTVPNYEFSENSDTVWKNQKSVYVKTWDDHSGIKHTDNMVSGMATTNARFEWYTEPQAATDSSPERDRAEVTKEGNLDIFKLYKDSDEDMEDIYYLGAKIWAVDMPGKMNTTTLTNLVQEYTYIGPFYIDNVSPTAGTLIRTIGNTIGSDNYTTSTSSTEGWTKENVTIKMVEGTDGNTNDEAKIYEKSDGTYSNQKTTYTVLKDGVAYLSNQTGTNTLTETGEYQIIVTTIDCANNTAINEYTVKIDKELPTKPQVTNSSNGQWTNQDITVTMADSSDNHSGFYRYESELNTGDNVDINGSRLEETVEENPATRVFSEETTEDTYLQVWAFDKAGNENGTEYDINGEKLWIRIDTTKPTWTTQNFTRDTTNSKVTVNLVGTDALSGIASSSLTADKITVYVDGEKADSITKTLTGENGNYTLTLSGFEQARESAEDLYSNWSGTVSIDIAEGTLTDKAGNQNIKQEGLSIGFADFIGPDIRYKYFGTTRDQTPTSSPDINYDDKTFKMEIDVTDKYYDIGTAENKLKLSDFEIKMYDGKNEYDLNSLYASGKIDIAFDVQAVTVASLKKTTNINAGTVETVENAVVGYKYIITLLNLEQVKKAVGATTADYSGVVTVSVASDKVTDTSNNRNKGESLTSGVNFPGGQSPSDNVVVDVVDPIWEGRVKDLDLATGNATVEIIGTDTYFDNSTLTSEDIKIFANGSEVTTGISKTLGNGSSLTETRIVNGITTTNVQYGIKYELNVSGFPTNVNQVKIQISQGTLTDQSGNTNKANTDIIIYNVLKSTSTENGMASGFLGNHSIKREQIDQVEFYPSTANAIDATKWDVSAQGDGTIIAWYETLDNGALKVCLGSDYPMFANRDSSYLFSYIGYGANCTSTQTIIDLDLLNTTSATNMKAMFWFTGYRSMTTLDLTSLDTSNVTNMREMFTGCGYNNMTSVSFGSNFKTNKVVDMSWMFANFGYTKLENLTLPNTFNTSSVIDMSYMFMGTGYTAMTELNIGTVFNTSNVEDMSYMFKLCGYTAMTELDLETNFNTSKVTDMSSMFEKCGFTSMENLNLGTNFNTGKVTNMKSMFAACGYAAMTELSLGEVFDTKSVTDMKNMFTYCGYVSMTSLDLGNKFYTTNVTDMTQMFYNCGFVAMTTLDLGPAFTKIVNTGFITMCGKNGEITIYGPEAIYSNKTNFKLNSDDSTQIAFTRGTIIPIYKPQWDAIGTEIVKSNGENISLKITLKGNANHSETISGTNVKINYSNDVTTNLVPEDISVYIEGTELTNISTSVEELGTTTATDIIQTITITNFKEELMQTGKNYREWSGNLTLKIGGREESSDTYSVKSLVDQYGNQYMSQTDEGQTDGTWIDINFKDDEETNKNTAGKLFADIVKPEIMYKYSEADINKNLKTVKVVFSVTDKYFESSNLSISDLTVLVDGKTVNWWTEADGETSTKPRKTLSEPTDVTGIVNGVENVVVGKQYTLTLTNLEQKEITGSDKYLDYSGIVTVAINAGKVVDKSGNTNESKTITMGIDLPEDADQTPVIADVVDPLWTVETDASGKLILKGTDKYLDKDNSSLEESDVTIYADLDGNGTTEVIPGASVTLSNSTILTEERTIDGQKQQVPYGIQYELGLQISLDTVLTTFTDTRTAGVQSQYREDNGVNTKIKIAGGTLVDLYENTSKEQEIELNGEEVVSPEIIYKYANTTIGSGAEGNKKVTVVFDVTDKRFVNSNISIEDLTILIDEKLYGDENDNGTIDEGETGIESISTLTKKHDLYASISEVETLVGARYELVIGNNTGNLDQGKGFDYSGSVTISIPAGELNDDNTLKVGAIDGSGNLNTAKTITIGIDEPEDADQTPVIVDVVDPIWKVVSGPTVTQDANGKTQATVEIIGTDKYFKQSTLEKKDIQIWINGLQIAGKDENGNLITIAPELTTNLTSQYVKWNSVDETYEVKSQADANGQKYIFTLSNLEESNTAFMEKLNQYLADSSTGRPYKEYSGEAKVIIPSGKVVDNSGNIDNGLIVDLGKIDTLKPEIIKISAENGTMQDPDDETKIIPIQTITFIATDKYFDTTDSLEESEITVKINGESAESIEKDLAIIDTIKADVNGDGTVDNAEIVGYKYQLILSNFEQTEKQIGKEFIEWSGNVSIDIKTDAIKDKSLNENELTTIDGKFADFIAPKVEQGTASNNISEKTQTITFKVTDKYIDSELTADDIAVKINGETAESVDIANAQQSKIYKDLSSTPIKYDVNRNGTIEEDEIVGYNYTLVLSNFEQTEKQTGKDFVEWSGNVSIEIAEGVIKDKGPNGDRTNQNTVEAATVNGIFADFIAPKVENIEATNDPLAKTQTITFTAIDKYFDSISENDIEIRIDGEIPGDTNGNGQIDEDESLAITKSLLTTLEEFKADIDGDGTEEIIGYEYQLILSNFEQTRTSVNDNRKFVDWSGTVEVIIPDGTVKDKGPNGDGTNPNGNEEASIEKFADFIAPDIIYQYVSGDIDKTGKTFTMAFDVTDKYFNESTFATQYINAETEADKLAILKNYLTIYVDGENITNIDTVTKKITEISDIENTFKKTVNGTVSSGTYTVGKHFVLEISGLEQDESTLTGDSYLDYSGVITVAIKGTTEGTGTGIATDTGTEGDGINTRTNVATTLTSGVDIPGGVIPDDEVIVDVVDPLWQQAGSVTGKAIEQTATIPIRVTDKYIKKDASGKLVSELQSSDITVKVNGEVKSSTDGISVVVVEDTSATLTYGKQYKVTVTGFVKDATQISITLRQGIVVDESGNRNKETTFILFSSLKQTDTETSANSGFLGNTSIERQKIEKIIFQNNLDGINDTKWKASAQDDESIMAWYETRTVNGTTLYTVYIGSNVLMNANPNSSYLFSYIGYNSNCIDTSTTNPLIENIELLNVGSVTNMEGMFQYFGHKTMSSLSLGTGFDTTNVTNMSYMFKQCGYTEMTTLNLGENFNTLAVENMSNMFNGCGTTLMTNIYFGSTTGIAIGEITLPSNFDTTNVTNMSGMFQDFGKGKVVKLDLGTNFNTQNVQNMSNMFNGCGTSEMTTLTLGTKFNTSTVTNMSGMFQDFAQAKMTSLLLGDCFYTNAVTDMSNMFNGCGSTSMTSLDLGPAFANIPTTNSGFATNLGKNGEIKVYTGEGIYLNKNAFKLNTENVTEIEYTRGQIIPKYAPIWTEKESSYDEDAQTLTIILEGKVNSNYSESTTKTVNNLLTEGTVTTNTTTPLNLRIDGVEANAVTKVISDKTTGEEVVQATITLSGFEKGRVTNSYFKEWSGNIALQLARGTLKDVYGNANLAQTDESGTMEKVEVKEDSTTNRNATNAMFADFIKPEFTYTYSESDINHTNESVTVVFDVTDKYFDSTTLSNLDASQITVRVADYDITTLNNSITKQLTKTATLVMDKTTKVVTAKSADYTITDENAEQKVGERYQLVVTDLDQEDANGIGNAFDFSGHMSLAFNSGVITDKSGNTSDATTITIGLNENDGEPNDDTIHGSGVIVDVVDPIWQLGNISLEEGKVELKAIDKYFGSVTIDEDDILVYVNGKLDGDTNENGVLDTGETPKVFKDITSTTATDIENGKQYTLKLSNITTGGADVPFTPYNVDELNSTAGFYYGDENGGTISIKILAGTITDQYGNTSVDQSFEIGDIDATKPRVYPVRNIQDADAGTETIIFNVTDKNYDSTDLITLDVDKNDDGVVDPEITVWLDGNQIDGEVIKQLTYKPIYLNATTIVGHQYTLVLSEIIETDEQYSLSGREYRELSGTIEIRIEQDAVKDVKGNILNEDVTISDYIDYIKPELKELTVANPINTTDKTYTTSFEIRDKYLDDTSDDTQKVQEDEIKVYVDGELVTAIAKPQTAEAQESNKDKIWMELESTSITATFKKTVNGTITNGNYTVGHTYTLVLSNFEQSVKQSGKNFIEWSGTVKIVIDQDAVNDKNGETGEVIYTLDSDETKRTVGGYHVDFVKPVVEKVDSIRGTNTEKIVFDVLDKYLDTSDVIADNEITVYVDEETATLTKALTKTAKFVMNKETKEVISQTTDYQVQSTEQVVGERYQLVLSGFEQSSRNTKNYKDWSGTVSIEIVPNAVKDIQVTNPNGQIAGGNLNDETTVDGDFVDFINPDIKYTHQSTDISKGTKSYTMTFDITDKYYTTGQLDLDDLTIKMQNGQVDSNGNAIVYDLETLANQRKVNIAFNAVPYYAEPNIKVTNSDTGEVETITTVDTHQIGHTYTLTISNLEKIEIETGLTTANYSGIVTVAIDGNVIQDRGPSGDGTSQNGNAGKTITSGVSIPGGTISDAQVVDVVKPRIDKVSSSANAVNKTAEITFKGTDTYFVENSTISIDDMEVYINGVKTTSGITKTITATTKLEEQRIGNYVQKIEDDELEKQTVNVQYGVQYTLEIKDFAQNINQIKVKIPAGKLTDQYGNSNVETDLIVYNTLKREDMSEVSITEDMTVDEIENEWDSILTDEFLGESTSTTIYPINSTLDLIERQDIEKIEFVNDLDGLLDGEIPKVWDTTAKEWNIKSGIQRVWDISAQGDKSILAWTTQTGAPYTVYVGSAYEIFGNQNSRYLFAGIGSGTNSTSVTTIAGINLLNTSSVTSMYAMFYKCGYTAMTSLNLENFDTSNVLVMRGMFSNVGFTSMTSLTLSETFDTSNVIGMEAMFRNSGYTKMTSLTLPESFDTSNVTEMEAMFEGCGNAKMTTLDLGSAFESSKVTNMKDMFNGCGQNKMTTFKIGSATNNTVDLNTTLVTNMSGMFQNFGQGQEGQEQTGITSLVLGGNFDTSAVTNMSNMFNGTGKISMISLNLGNKFNTSKVTNMSGMFQDFGQTALTSLDLGDLFYTTSATDMSNMFNGCGTNAMTTLDLGPAFTKIAGTYGNMFKDCGKTGLKIYAPESIYSNMTTFK